MFAWRYAALADRPNAHQSRRRSQRISFAEAENLNEVAFIMPDGSIELPEAPGSRHKSSMDGGATLKIGGLIGDSSFDPFAPSVDEVGAATRDTYGDLVPRKHVTVVLSKKKVKEKLGIKLAGGIDSGDFSKQHVYILGFDGKSKNANLRKGDIVSSINGNSAEGESLKTVSHMLSSVSVATAVFAA